MKRVFFKIIISILSILLIYCTKSYAANDGTVRMEMNGGPMWNNIDVSESYQECEDLNSSMSTLGTTALKAHLITDADWSAMAIFSVSQYGGARSNMPNKTNGNNSGITDISYNFIQTTGLADTATKNTNRYISGLFNDDGTVKKYIKQWPTNRLETNFVGFVDTYSWYGGNQSYASDSRWPVSLKSGLFGVIFCDAYGVNVASGMKGESVTFRPAIWN